MREPMQLVIGCDEAGVAYKTRLAEDLCADPRVAGVKDLGVYATDDRDRTYGEIGIAAAEYIATGQAERGILVCGTGIGMAIAANKVPGIRATVAHDSLSVERSILSNNCQIITLGQRVIGIELARRLVREWLGYAFDPQSPSNHKLGIISDYEQFLGLSGR